MQNGLMAASGIILGHALTHCGHTHSKPTYTIACNGRIRAMYTGARSLEHVVKQLRAVSGILNYMWHDASMCSSK